MRPSTAIAGIFLSLAASTFAYTVTVPNDSTGWTNSGSQPLAWQRVNTDPLNFTVALVNQGQNPPINQILAALVDGTLLNTTVNPTGGGWPTGKGFQVNLLASDSNSTILAQSNQFTISAGNTTSVISSSQFATGTTSASDGGVVNPTTGPYTPSNPNSASWVRISPGLIGVLALAAFLT
jgi:hypothetical protein